LNTYFCNYIDLVDENDLIEAFKRREEKTLSLFLKFSNENYAYAHGKWSVKQVLQHIIDAERVLSYRALRFSRKDTTDLSIYDEDAYVANFPENTRSLKDTLEEYLAVRASTIFLYRAMNDDMLDFVGTSGNEKSSARIMAWATIGHETHHCNVLLERYLNVE
jgi:uncharacterized damage-inducible protein DinB